MVGQFSSNRIPDLIYITLYDDRWAPRIAVLRAAKLAHFDETGFRAEEKLHSLHSASTSLWALITCHPRRRREAMNTAGFLVLGRAGRRPATCRWYPGGRPTTVPGLCTQRRPDPSIPRRTKPATHTLDPVLRITNRI